MWVVLCVHIIRILRTEQSTACILKYNKTQIKPTTRRCNIDINAYYVFMSNTSNFDNMQLTLTMSQISNQIPSNAMRNLSKASVPN